MTTKSVIVKDLLDARKRTLDLVESLSDDQLVDAPHPIANPLLWELGHVAWFQEFWASRHLRKEESLRADSDALYNSSTVAFAARPHLAVPDRRATIGYVTSVLERVVERIERHPLDERAAYFHRLVTFHEDMHGEAFVLTLQLRGYPPPPAWRRFESAGGEPLTGFVAVPGGTFALGADRAAPFVFDNEKWAHPVEVASFEIARAAVTNAEFAAFITDGGYGRRELWSAAGWTWRQSVGAECPLYWQKRDGQWRWRRFDREEPVAEHQPVCHVGWFEAEAYARWAGARLPTEAEWELAAAGPDKRAYPWGESVPTPAHANLDGVFAGCIGVASLSKGDSAIGCRQLFGNVWEWTTSDFLPYPGFVRDPYADYSEPWFGTHKVLRGGCWTTRARLLRNTWRNFYTPDRRDAFAGFRLARDVR